MGRRSRGTIQTKRALLSGEAIEKVLVAAEQISEYHWAVCVVLLETGMHPTALSELRTVNVKADAIEWRRVKNDRVCMALMTPRLKLGLEVFFKHGPKSRIWYWTLVKQVGEAAGVPELSPMSFRKTYLVALLQMGYPAEAIAQMAGCSVKVVREAYLYLSPAELREILTRQASMLTKVSESLDMRRRGSEIGP